MAANPLSWKDIPLTRLPNGPAVEEYLTQLRLCYVNGSAFFYNIQLPMDSEPHRLMLAGKVCGEDENAKWFFNRFLHALNPPELNLTAADRLAVTGQNRIPHLTLDGFLASALVFGGAYKNFAGTANEAKALGWDVCRELFGDRWEDVEAFNAPGAWAKFFYDVAWDITILGVDRKLARIWFLCATDTD